MKKLYNGEKIPSRIYYYLLDFVDQHFGILQAEFQEVSLQALTKIQIYALFEYATKRDMDEGKQNG